MFLEEYGSLWDIPCDALCITTNGSIRKDGKAVMGRGCAKEAADKWYGLQHALAAHIKHKGNHVSLLSTHNNYKDPVWSLLAFPVKHLWNEKADIKLIEQSCRELMQMTEKSGWERVLLPRPGCGNGGLTWDPFVKLTIAPLLDERIVVVSWKA